MLLIVHVPEGAMAEVFWTGPQVEEVDGAK
jgi:hypothetical protein